MNVNSIDLFRFIQVQLLINMVRLISGAEERLTDSISNLMVTKSFI